MKTDTADRHRNDQWVGIDPDSKWLQAEGDVKEWTATLALGPRIIDLGVGMDRHALWLAAQGSEVTALDAVPGGLVQIAQAGSVKTAPGRMDVLPFEVCSFDHVLIWSMIYYGDEDLLLGTIPGFRQVLTLGGTFKVTIMSKRRLAHERAAAPGREISRNTWVFEAATSSDKTHPHHFCSAAELLALCSGFEVKWLEDRQHEKPGSWHWHLLMERL